jgi:hypothetical protein
MFLLSHPGPGMTAGTGQPIVIILCSVTRVGLSGGKVQPSYAKDDSKIICLSPLLSFARSITHENI